MKKIILSILILGMVLGSAREALALRIPVGLQRPNILLHADVITALGRGKKSIFALADRWSIAGKFNDVVIFLESLNSGDSDIQNYLAITREKINALKTCKDLEKKGFTPIIVPDGKGGFFVDTLGFEGKWVLRNTTEEVIDNGYKLRALKSISIAIAETRSRSLVSIDSFGSVYVVGDVKSIEQAFHPHPDIAIKNQWTGTEETVIYVTPSFMKMDMMAQRDILRNALKFTGYYYSIAKSISFGYGTFSAEKEEILETGPVQLVSLNEVSNIGVNLLGQALEKKRIGAQCNFFTDEEKDNILSERASGVELNGSESDESILRKYEAMFRKAILEMKQKSSRIICISVTTSMLDKTNLFIEMVKKEMPDSIVILGGPMASTPEQLGALIPKADVVVRGEADKVFPELVDVLNKCKDSQDLTEEQIKELLALPGGIFVRIGPAFIVNNLHKSNRVDYPNLQKPRDRKRDNILFSSRGCPYDCWFCSQPFGNKFRPVSNREIVEWLITRLELEFRERKDVNINFFLKEGRDLFQYGLAEPIDIEIYDDNFFLDKNRIKDLCRRIKALGMDRYFHFDIMGGSIRAFYKNGKIDTELADNLWDAGFRDIVFGTDGLSNAILEQNNKGYGFDEVIALNKYLREKGFLVQNAFICSTPQASYLEFFENMFLSAVSTNISLLSGNPGIIGDQATSFGKLDALNFAEKYIWEGNRPMDKVYEDKEGYLVPKQPEYAYRKHTLLHVMDAGVEDILVKAKKGLNENASDMFRRIYAQVNEEIVDQVINKWNSSDSPELKALSKIVSKMRQEVKGIGSISFIGNEIGRQMHEFGLSSFQEYMDKIYAKRNSLIGLKLEDVTTIEECFTFAREYINKGLIGKAASELRKAKRLEPRNLEVYYAEAALYTLMKSYGDVSFSIMDCINSNPIPVPVDFKDNERFFKGFVDRNVMNQFANAKISYPDSYSKMGEDLRDFNAQMQILIYNIRQYISYLKKESDVVITRDFPLPLTQGERIKAFGRFTEEKLLGFLGDDRRAGDMDEEEALSGMNAIGLQYLAFRNFGNIDLGRKESRARAMYMNGIGILGEFSPTEKITRDYGKRLYVAHRGQCKIVSADQHDVICGSFTNTAYAVIWDDSYKIWDGSDKSSQIGLMGISMDMDAGDILSVIKKAGLKNPKVILAIDKGRKDKTDAFIEKLRGAKIDCECVVVDSNYLAVAANIDGYIIFDRANQRVEKVAPWKRLGPELEAVHYGPNLNFGKFLTADTGIAEKHALPVTSIVEYAVASGAINRICQ